MFMNYIDFGWLHAAQIEMEYVIENLTCLKHTTYKYSLMKYIRIEAIMLMIY